MQMHQLIGKSKEKKRIGRGGKRGKTSGRGQKGQKARAGHKIRPAIRDYLKQIPKRRGRHKHSFVSQTIKAVVVDIKDVEARYASGETVTPKTLVAKGLISTVGGRMPHVKILGSAKLAKRLTVKTCEASVGAKKAIEEAGGTIA